MQLQDLFPDLMRGGEEDSGEPPPKKAKEAPDSAPQVAAAPSLPVPVPMAQSNPPNILMPPPVPTVHASPDIRLPNMLVSPPVPAVRATPDSRLPHQQMKERSPDPRHQDKQVQNMAASRQHEGEVPKTLALPTPVPATTAAVHSRKDFKDRGTSDSLDRRPPHRPLEWQSPNPRHQDQNVAGSRQQKDEVKKIPVLPTPVPATTTAAHSRKDFSDRMSSDSSKNPWSPQRPLQGSSSSTGQPLTKTSPRDPRIWKSPVLSNHEQTAHNSPSRREDPRVQGSSSQKEEPRLHKFPNSQHQESKVHYRPHQKEDPRLRKSPNPVHSEPRVQNSLGGREDSKPNKFPHHHDSRQRQSSSKQQEEGRIRQSPDPKKSESTVHSSPSRNRDPKAENSYPNSKFRIPKVKKTFSNTMHNPPKESSIPREEKRKPAATLGEEEENKKTPESKREESKAHESPKSQQENSKVQEQKKKAEQETKSSSPKKSAKKGSILSKSPEQKSGKQPAGEIDKKMATVKSDHNFKERMKKSTEAKEDEVTKKDRESKGGQSASSEGKEIKDGCETIKRPEASPTGEESEEQTVTRESSVDKVEGAEAEKTKLEKKTKVADDDAPPYAKALEELKTIESTFNDVLENTKISSGKMLNIQEKNFSPN